MAKFINKRFIDNVDAMSKSTELALQAPYFIHNDLNPVITKYLNQIDKQTSIDYNDQSQYSVLGSNSPLRFNEIKDLVIYTDFKFEADISITEEGYGSEPITGEAFVLPDTIIPKENDMFRVQSMKKPLIFRVTGAKQDTAEIGCNFWKFTFKLEYSDQDSLEELYKQVTTKSTYMMQNIGTDYKNIIVDEDYLKIERLDNLLDKLKEFYNELFYSSAVETYIYNWDGDYFYDPYVIEFILRNELMQDENSFLFITHQVALAKTFKIDYYKSMFSFLEDNRKPFDKSILSGQAEYIRDSFSIFSSRGEPYFKISYNSIPIPQKRTIDFLDEELLEKINKNELYTNDDEFYYRNVIIKYINNEDINDDEYESIMNIDFLPTIQLFYELIIIIFIIDKIITKLLK